MQLDFTLTQQTAALKRKPDTTKDINGVHLTLKFLWKCQELRIGQTILKMMKVGKPATARLNIERRQGSSREGGHGVHLLHGGIKKTHSDTRDLAGHQLRAGRSP